MKFVGIDPGSVSCGISIIESLGSETRLVAEKTIKLKGNMALRLMDLRAQILDFLDGHKIEEGSIESIFAGINVQSLIKLSQARGVAMEALAASDVKVFEYAPRDIKKAVSVTGSAPKEQLRMIVSSILGVDDKAFSSADSADAAAIALCHSFKRNFQEFVQ